MKDNQKKAYENIFRINLKVRKTERTLVFTDGFNRRIKKIGRLVAEAGNKFTEHMRYIEYAPTGCHGVEPPEEVWKEAFGNEVYEELRRKKLLSRIIAKKITEKQLHEIERIIKIHKDEAARAVIALSYYSTSHTRFRDLLNRICGARYASMPLFDEHMFAGPMTVDWKGLSERTKKIARRVGRCDDIQVESPNGTFLTFSKRGREAKSDTGIITRPGQFSNLPAGEVYLAPLEGTARGKLVLEWAPTRKMKSPVTLYVQKGLVRKIEGNEKYADILREKIAEKKENRNIAELGIGTNDKASRPDNILESEKIFGTIHIALGDNSSFGGTVTTSFHQDFVFFKPTITLIYKSGQKRCLMKDGNLVIGRAKCK